MPNEDSAQWLEIIARSLAFLALHQSGHHAKELSTQGQFLERLGLPRREAAELLGTTPASLTELYRQARQKKGGAHGRKKE